MSSPPTAPTQSSSPANEPTSHDDDDDDATTVTARTPDRDSGPDLDSASSRLPPSQESTLLDQTNAHKTTANALFARSSYSDAIQSYNSALGACPAYFDYDIAVLRANIAACHLKMREWRDAVGEASKALEGLCRVDPLVEEQKERGDGSGEGEREQGQVGKEKKQKEDKDEGEAEAEAEAEKSLAAQRARIFHETGRATLADARRIRVKALLRRAKAREELGGWAELQGAMEDYTALATSPLLQPHIASLDRAFVQTALRKLPQRLEEEKSKEMADMMGKLKQLGNGILKPFGLSTDNFSFVKDDGGGGGYSVQFKPRD